MLKLYFSTVIIYAIIILCLDKMYEDQIRRNGWFDGIEKARFSEAASLFMLSAVPIFRTFVVLFIFVAASTKKPTDTNARGGSDGRKTDR